MEQRAETTFDLTAENPERRLSALNRDRLRRVYESLTRRQREFIDALPLLFHINHPLLPGYVTRETPCGIAGYTPSEASVRAARALSRSFEFDRRAAPRIALRGLYMMGSPGTIAYSRTSDLDMWLIHDPKLDAEAVAALADKGRRIEAFAATLDLEVHFFVFDAERMRSGETLSLSDESSGSSQHYVLLDEFYRSGLLVAGLPPLWWRIPSCYERNYDDYLAAAAKRRMLDPTDYIDFGALPSIPAEEFFGAAVWQLYKSIRSPYKSVLKLLLMEAYAAEYPDIVLLSTRYKQNVESNNVELDAIDPYILMYTKAEEYLMARNEPQRLDVLRRSFYIKANVTVSDPRLRRRDDWRGELMIRMVEAWGWSEQQVARLDQRDDWRLEIAVEERRDLTMTLKESYAMLSRFARDHANETKITERDLHVLGRKLYAAFERKPSKIDVVTRGICVNPTEPSLSLHESRLGDRRVWLLFTGNVSPAEAGFRNPVRRSGSPAELVLWCHLNRLADNATTWHVFANSSSLDSREVIRIKDTIARVLVGDESSDIVDDLISQPRLARAALLVNAGVDPFASADAAGDIRTSDLTDPLAFGGRGINLVHSVDLMFVTSWDEVFTFRFEGAGAVLEAIGELAQWLPTLPDGAALPAIETRCMSRGQTAQIAERVGEMVRSALAFLGRHWRAATTHYVMQCNGDLHHLALAEGIPALHRHAGPAALMRVLAAADDDAEQQVRFDAACTRAGLLPLLYRHHRTGVIQVFALQRGPRADVYVIDERGALLVQRQECDSVQILLQHYRRFLDATLPRCQHPGDGTPPGIELVEVIPSARGHELLPHRGDQTSDDSYLPLRVFADADSDGHQHFTIHAGDREFSTWEHGGSLFVQVAELVTAQRDPGHGHPIYITDLDLSTRFRRTAGVKALRPYDLLSYKKRIEFQLTRAMHQDDTIAGTAVGIAS